MHTLILNLYYPPDTGATARILEEVAGVLAQKHQVTVVAGRPSYDPEERHPYYLSRTTRQGNLRVVRVGTTAFERHRMFGRASNYLSYLALGTLRALTIRPSPDVIVSMTDPPVAVAAAGLLKRIRGCPLFYNIQDLHPDMAVQSGMISQGLPLRLWDTAHRWGLHQADRITVLGEDMRDRVLAKGIDASRVTVARHGAPRLPSPDTCTTSTREVRWPCEFMLVHAGNVGYAGAWHTLIRATGMLAEEGVGMLFIGDGAARESVQASVNGKGNVHFAPFRPRDELPLVYATGDLHVVTVRRGLEGLVVPSKLYTILAAGRPVLVVADESTDAARLVRKYGCGLVCNPDDPASVVEAVRWVRSDPNRLPEMARRSLQAANDCRREHEIHKLIALIEETASQGNAERKLPVSAPEEGMSAD